MKNLILGIIIGILISGTSARALGVTIENITAYDMFCGVALGGVLSHTLGSPDQVAKDAFAYADAMYKRRNSK